MIGLGARQEPRARPRCVYGLLVALNSPYREPVTASEALFSRQV